VKIPQPNQQVEQGALSDCMYSKGADLHLTVVRLKLKYGHAFTVDKERTFEPSLNERNDRHDSSSRFPSIDF